MELQVTSISPISNRQAGKWRREGDGGQALPRAPGPTDREAGWPGALAREKKTGDGSRHRGAARPQLGPAFSLLWFSSAQDKQI